MRFAIIAVLLSAAIALPDGTAAASAPPATGRAIPSHAASPRATAPRGTIIETKGFAGADGEWRYQIWSVWPDGTHAHALTTDPDLLPYTAAPNRQGTRVAFTVGRGSRWPVNGLYVIAMNGYGQHNLLRGHSELTAVRDPTWSADGSRLAFVASDRSFAQDIWTVKADGTGLRRATHCNCAWTNTPRWSPVDNLMLWSPNTYDLALLNPATGVSRELYDNRPSGALTVSDYDWTADGKAVVFSGHPWDDTTRNVYRIARTGGAPVQLAADTWLDYGKPHMSPDGSHVVVSVFNADGTDTNGTDLWILDATRGTAAPHRAFPLPYQDEATGWTRTCTVGCAPGGRWSQLTASFETLSGVIVTTGGLMPAIAGTTITVTLARRVGTTWRAVRSTRVRTTNLSTYVARTRRAGGGLCRLTARWGGSALHRAASVTTRSFGC